VDRLGRSLQDLVGFLSELHALKMVLMAGRVFPRAWVPIPRRGT
jgi:hypothetical protein